VISVDSELGQLYFVAQDTVTKDKQKAARFRFRETTDSYYAMLEAKRTADSWGFSFPAWERL
jgi:hypothetical protein